MVLLRPRHSQHIVVPVANVTSSGCATHAALQCCCSRRRRHLTQGTAARIPFSARHARVASAATANVLSVFPLSLPLQRLSPMSSATFWSDACRNARNRPLQAQLDAVYASCGVTVRQPPLLPLGACPAHVRVAGCLVLFKPLLRRLRRIVCALWRAAGCCICGGGWMRRGGGACGRCTDGFAG